MHDLFKSVIVTTSISMHITSWIQSNHLDDSLSLNNVVGIIYFMSVTKASNDLTLSHATSEIHEKCDM